MYKFYQTVAYRQLTVVPPQSDYLSTDFQLEFTKMIFAEWAKPENLEKPLKV